MGVETVDAPTVARLKSEGELRQARTYGFSLTDHELAPAHRSKVSMSAIVVFALIRSATRPPPR